MPNQKLLDALTAAEAAIAEAKRFASEIVPAPQPPLKAIGDIAKLYRRGLNLGDMLDAPAEGAWPAGKLAAADFDFALAAGFDHVRITARSHAYLDNGRIAESWLDRLAWACAQAQRVGLRAIFDPLHHADKEPFNGFAQPDLLAQLWHQLAARFKDLPGDWCFELVNEPKAPLDGKALNGYLAKALAAIRAHNPTRAVHVGAAINNTTDIPPHWKAPADSWTILQGHCYLPGPFSHQQESWAGNTPKRGWDGTDAEKAEIRAQLDKAPPRWPGPIHMGEFGCTTKADQASRLRYLRFMREEFERRGWGWTVWNIRGPFGLTEGGKFQPGVAAALGLE